MPGPDLDTRNVELAPETTALADVLATHLRGRGTLGDADPDTRRSAVRELLKALVVLGVDLTAASPSGDPADGPVEAARRRTEELLGSGQALLGCEASEAALQLWPEDLRLRQLHGLALVRSGAVDRANAVMRELQRSGAGDAETLGILARTHKEMAARARSEAERTRHLEAAFQAYREGYATACAAGDSEAAWFTGINAATVSLLSGADQRARELAGEVKALCQRELASEPGRASYWLHASLGEAALLLGDSDLAASQYAEAGRSAKGRFADLSTTLRQAQLLCQVQERDASWLDDCLRVPPVLVFSGHMIDHPDRPAPRFPSEREPAVTKLLAEHIAGIAPCVGYASAACGGDILFHEAMRALGRETHVILPFPAKDFVRTSVEHAGASWVERFEAVLRRAASLTVASDHPASGGAANFGYTNLILSGMAALHAGQLHSELRGLAIWDGRPGDGAGGTSIAVAGWQSRNLSVDRVDPSPEVMGSRPPAARPEPDTEPGLPLRAMLFADAVGYSKLSEDQIPLFSTHLLAPVARLIERFDEPPMVKETAGDGLYFVFADVRAAGLFAMELRELFAGTDWTRVGLPRNLALRIGLHCGPVHKLVDPITGLEKYTGPHTSRTARIEPITPPGQVYASYAFAAVAAAEGIEELEFEYVGRTELAKQEGAMRLYHVRRAPDATGQGLPRDAKDESP